MPFVPDATVRIENSVIVGRAGPIRVREYLPTVEAGRAPFVWLHGGGFAFGGLDMKESDAPARFLAAAGRRVRTVDYRLAPKISPFTKPDLRPKPNRYPAALHDVVDAAADLAAVTGRSIAMGGASAGANLAASAALMIRDERTVDVISLVLAYGAFHAVLPDDNGVERTLRGPLAGLMFNQAMVTRIYLNYTGSADLLVPGYAVPGGADLHDLPPTFLLNADNDRLRRTGHAFADELRSSGVEVREETVRGTHGFLNSNRKPGFDERMGWIAAWLDEHDPHV